MSSHPESGTSAGDDPTTLERLLTFDARRGDIAFTLVLWGFIGVLIVTSFDLDPKDRHVPLVVAVPTFLLLSTVLLMSVSDRFAAFADRIADTEVFGAAESSLPIADEADEDEEGQTLLEWRTSNLIAFVTVFGLFALVYVVGFYVAIPIFLLIVYRFGAKQSWPVTIGTTVLLWVFVVLVFHVVLSVRLYPGILELEITPYVPF